MNGIVALTLISCLTIATGPRAARPMEDVELLERMQRFEAEIAGQPRDVIQSRLRSLGAEMITKQVHVRSGIVAATYERHKESNVYFGYNYDRADHFYLSELDPEIDGLFRSHRHWASVVRTFPSRQVSFELPIDRETFNSLKQGQPLEFTCSPVVLVRPKSVYCWPISLAMRRPDVSGR